MTTIPKPADPTAAFTATYDAWNRLVKLEDGSGTVAQYEYDGAKRRTVKKSYTGGTLTETRHFYYTEPSKWQVVEERVDSETDPDRQFVWGQRYIDDLVLRDRDTDSDGDLDERLFGMQDANWNVTGIVDSAGDVQERYSYSAYGQSTALTAGFGERGPSSFQWETRFTSGRLDLNTHVMILRLRYAHVGIGLWLSRDPQDHRALVNGYSFLASNPLVKVDPQGTHPLQECPGESSGLEKLLDIFDKLQKVKDIKELLEALSEGGGKIGVPDVASGKITGSGLDIVLIWITALDKFEPETPCGMWFRSVLKALTCAMRTCKSQQCNGLDTASEGSALNNCIIDLQKGKGGLAAADLEEKLKILAGLTVDNCKAAATNSACCKNGVLQSKPGCGGNC
jgi:RHS repeat-associated protein